VARFSWGRMRISPLTSEEADRVLGHVAPEERYSQAWLQLNERLYAGHEAVWQGAYLLPAGFLLRPLRLLPGFHPVSRRLYRWVADRRSSSCRIGGGGG